MSNIYTINIYNFWPFAMRMGKLRRATIFSDMQSGVVVGALWANKNTRRLLSRSGIGHKDEEQGGQQNTNTNTGTNANTNTDITC